MSETGGTSRRVCPGCQSAMQTFRAGEVELDRCFFCGGVFLDKGELDRVAGHPVEVTPGDTPGERICAGCGATLAPARAGAITVDLCPTCAGIYLDAGELERLAGEVDLKRVDADPTHGPITFRCPGCDGTFDVAEGVTTQMGIACARCAPGLSSLGGEDLLAPSGGYVYTEPTSGPPIAPSTAELGFVNALLTALHLFLGT